MKYPRLSIIIFLYALAGVLLMFSRTSTAEVNDFEKLRKESVKIKTLQADFVQRKIMKILSRPLISQGRFYFTTPDAFRWEYVKPLKSVVVSQNQRTKRYMYADGKWVEDQTGGAQTMRFVLSEIAGWMNGRFDQNPSFKATISQKGSTRIILTPVEKGMKGMIERIEITLAPRAGVVQSVKILESADNVTQINFSNVKMNHVIESSVFRDIE